MQQDCFPTDLAQLKFFFKSAQHENDEVIHIGGCLCHSDWLNPEAIYPVILNAKHQGTQLFIKDFDEQLHHPNLEDSLQRFVAIIGTCGREAI